MMQMMRRDASPSKQAEVGWLGHEVQLHLDGDSVIVIPL